MGRLALIAVSLTGSASGQEPGTTDDLQPREERPGKYRVGALYLTPRFVFGPIGFDSNVFYTAIDRQEDVTISGGPGLDVILPFGRGGRLYTTGELIYLYFVRTESQRRLTGAASGGLATRGGRIEVLLEEEYRTMFGRPSYEIDERVEQRNEGTLGRIKGRLFGRFSLLLEGQRQRWRTDSGTDYLGTDVGDALTRDEYRTAAELSYRVSVKTNFVLRGEYQWNRYPRDEFRDSDLRLFAAGLRTDRSALVSGHALAGVRFYKAKASSTERRITWADVDATLNISTRTRFGGGYSRDLNDSFFVPADGVPAYLSEAANLRLEKTLTTRVDLRLYGKKTRYLTEAPVTIVPPEGDPVTAIRDDVTWEGGADLGYRFRPAFRVGVVVSYTDRRSTFEYFGVEGLIVGFSAQFTPN